MDVREYMALMGVTFGGSMDQKLKASFEIFDRNGDGSLSKEEVRQMLTMVVRQVTRAQLKAKTKNVRSQNTKANPRREHY
jgi:Ca2+-binding EF-hand superfamily protein